MHPESFKRVPKCGCSRERREFRKADDAGLARPNVWRVDDYRNSGREHAARPCTCDGYSHPHRRAGGWCVDNLNWTAEDAELRSAYS